MWIFGGFIDFFLPSLIPRIHEESWAKRGILGLNSGLQSPVSGF